jgi:hypothetical protein
MKHTKVVYAIISMRQPFQAWNVTSSPEARILTLQRKPVGFILAMWSAIGARPRALLDQRSSDF